MDARLDLRIAICRVTDFVQLPERVEHLPSRRLADTRRVVEKQHRRAAGAESNALITGWEEPACPQTREQRLVGIDRVCLREQDDEGRKVLILTAEPVTEPGAHAWASRLLKSSLNERDRWIVIDRLGVHRLDDGNVVDDFCRMRKELTHPRSRLSILCELEGRLCDEQLRLPHRLRHSLALTHRVGDLRSLEPGEHRLVIERLELRRPA